MKKIILLAAIVIASVGVANAQAPQRPNFKHGQRVEKPAGSFKRGQPKQMGMNKKNAPMLTDEQKATFKKFGGEQKQGRPKMGRKR